MGKGGRIGGRSIWSWTIGSRQIIVSDVASREGGNPVSLVETSSRQYEANVTRNPPSSLTMIHHAILSFHINVKLKKRVNERENEHMNLMVLMVGHRCPIIHRLNFKTHVDVKNGRLKMIKAVLRLS